jgi:hypothetical protein
MRSLVEWPPDILLTDINAPSEDGYSLIRRVRALKPDEGSDIPAIALTAIARPEDSETALSAISKFTLRRRLISMSSRKRSRVWRGSKGPESREKDTFPCGRDLPSDRRLSRLIFPSPTWDRPLLVDATPRVVSTRGKSREDVQFLLLFSRKLK